MGRDMTNLNQQDAQKNDWNVLVDLKSEVIGKAVFTGIKDNKPLSIMKSTKRFKVEGGWIYNSSTEIHKGKNISVAEALAFAPDNS